MKKKQVKEVETVVFEEWTGMDCHKTGEDGVDLKSLISYFELLNKGIHIW